MFSNESIPREYAIRAGHPLPMGFDGAAMTWVRSALSVTPGACQIVIRGGQQGHLHSHPPSEPSLIQPVMIRTDSIDQFKTWISVPDEVYSRYTAEMQWEIPGPWNGRKASLGSMSPEERIALDKAYYAYIFGNSRLVSTYREVLQACFSPFEAGIYRASLVRIEAQGDLIVQGCAAILDFDELIIEDGGRFILNAPCKASIRRMVKYPARLTKLN